MNIRRNLLLYFLPVLIIPIVLILGPDELANDQVTIKDMRSGEQISLDRGEMIAHIVGIL